MLHSQLKRVPRALTSRSKREHPLFFVFLFLRVCSFVAFFGVKKQVFIVETPLDVSMELADGTVSLSRATTARQAIADLRMPVVAEGNATT
jgi:hypothetical protein